MESRRLKNTVPSLDHFPLSEELKEEELVVKVPFPPSIVESKASLATAESNSRLRSAAQKFQIILTQRHLGGKNEEESVAHRSDRPF